MYPKTKKTIIKLLSFLNILLLTSSLFIPIISTQFINQDPHISRGFEFLGIYIIIFGFMLYYYAYEKNNLNGNIKSFWIVLLGYIVCFFNLTSKGFRTKFLYGTSLLIASLIIFIIIFLLIAKRTKARPAKEISPEPENLDGAYFLSYYPERIGDDINIYKTAVVLNNKRDYLEFITYKKDTTREKIKKKYITKIELRNDTIDTNNFDKLIDADYITDYTITNSIIHNFGPSLLNDELVKNVETYYSFSAKELNTFKIIYKDKDTKEIKSREFCTKYTKEQLKNKFAKSGFEVEENVEK